MFERLRSSNASKTSLRLQSQPRVLRQLDGGSGTHSKLGLVPIAGQLIQELFRADPSSSMRLRGQGSVRKNPWPPSVPRSFGTSLYRGFRRFPLLGKSPLSRAFRTAVFVIVSRSLTFSFCVSSRRPSAAKSRIFSLTYKARPPFTQISARAFASSGIAWFHVRLRSRNCSKAGSSLNERRAIRKLGARAIREAFIARDRARSCVAKSFLSGQNPLHKSSYRSPFQRTIRCPVGNRSTNPRKWVLVLQLGRQKHPRPVLNSGYCMSFHNWALTGEWDFANKIFDDSWVFGPKSRRDKLLIAKRFPIKLN